MYLASIKYAIFKKKAVPNKKFLINTKILKWSRGVGSFYAEGRIDNDLVCKSEFVLVLPDIIKKFL